MKIRISPYIIKKYSEIKSRILYYKIRESDESEYYKVIEKLYYRRFGEVLDWSNLKTYNQKMQWAKLYDKDPRKTILTDKYEVRKWVRGIIGEEYLIQLLGVWDSFEEINFESLPNKFVLKTSHGSGTNIIVKDKKNLSLKKTKRQINKWLKINYAYKTLESHYKEIKPRIIAEVFLESENDEIEDYKFICFNGVVHYCWVDTGRFTDHRRNIYNLKWQLQNWQQHHYKNTDDVIPKPENFEHMVTIAQKLCKGFLHVRIDLYNISGKVFFGEITFTNGSGFERITPEKYNIMLGELWELPIKK